ncbi:iron-sulfur cluster assembly scaffold protein NifU [Desulfomonile tiedjei]|uniref:Iron-sulfur cluster biosynthesis protein, NifU-like protein n=1 Tax=Desulfomonile tiedjei (strain ATCC 49306 / DSM 6799 / DCB-1) TaxID=706587 RepID=I4C541_DESTA|nr:iron-sulfur cluster assembly scaffold protein NifU [Desulfomonile tiedjei]AFM24682.1 iron-sulfur cluster biosynthesis protein, NifU-like protein [Desulfomonile tiedjei DSM 6799]
MDRDKDVFDDLEGMVVEEAKQKYSATVIDHFLNPRNTGIPESFDCYTYMSGICGDTIGIYVGFDNGRIARTGFVTNGCGPTVACSSAITCMVEGATLEEAMSITGKQLIEYLGGLPIENTHCADLAVNTLRGALAKMT